MATEIIFYGKSLKEIEKEGYKTLGNLGVLVSKTPIELFMPIKRKLEEIIKEHNPTKTIKTNYYAVFEETGLNETKKATDKSYYYKVHALEKVHQKP